jgi:hypothetical protein
LAPGIYSPVVLDGAVPLVLSWSATEGVTMMTYLIFRGAARNITGSRYLLETGSNNILVDATH